jgi:hypothetical protein
MDHVVIAIIINLLGACCALSRDRTGTDKIVVAIVLTYDLILIAQGAECLLKFAQ